MTGQAIAGVRPAGRIERYRHGERAVLRHYGLEPPERFVEVRAPAIQVRVVEVGSGPALLVAHGAFGGGPGSAALAKELPQHRSWLADVAGVVRRMEAILR